MVSEHEDGIVEGRVLAPPAPPGLVAPVPPDRAEHVAPHHRRADVRLQLLDHRSAGVDLAALFAVCLAPGLELGYPVVQLFAPNPERVLLALVGPGDVAVERRCDAESELVHLHSFLGSDPGAADRGSAQDSSASGDPAAQSVAPGLTGRGCLLLARRIRESPEEATRLSSRTRSTWLR
jgi:hypothetical protein